MIEGMEKMDETRKVSKEQLIEKIKGAKYDISMIGTIAFDLPWQELQDMLKDKFINEKITIHILRESETTIAQYALLTASQGEEADYGNLSRGNLLGIKEKVIREWKEFLVKSNDVNNIEPPEDKYAQKLGIIYYNEKRKYILKSYQINGCEEAFEHYMANRVSQEILSTKSSFLGHPEFVNKITVNIAKDPELVSRFAVKVDEELNQAVNKTNEYLAKIDILLHMDTLANKYKNMQIHNSAKGEALISLNIVVEAEGVEINHEFDLPIERWIDDFSMQLNAGDVKYRLEADKIQAVKRATEMKQKKLEEYEKDPEKEQRLFIKNCYMPIPVPMIKIDNELFITMALTNFDGIRKFQYTGAIIFDENTGSYISQKGKNGYMSLWQEEFVKYYEEYFINKNGAQKYSTEETQAGNRKEVIDIFDENRNRIGIGPRDAFLSNMAIVKSVVWALIFDRKGRILIHQRARNAKDNQGLWDKSVGGHVSTEDLDTIEAIKREIAEELFTLEHEGQGGHDIVEWMITNKNKIIYLGDWKTARFPDLSALNLNPDEYYNFSLNYPDINKRDFRREIVITERLLPNGVSVKAKCFVDAYLCIVSKDFNVSKLLNSNYVLLTPNELKRCLIKKSISLNENREYDPENGVKEEFRPTSDLAYLIESSIWDDIVTEFAKRVKETFYE